MSNWHTFADALSWGEDERIEIINGGALTMAAPDSPEDVDTVVEPDTENKTVRVMLHVDSGVLQLHEIYQQGDVAKVNVLEGCFIELSKMFSS